MPLKIDAYRYAIKNAFAHSGKAEIGAVVGKIMALHKDTDLKKAMPDIIEAVKKVNLMSMEEIEKEFRKYEEGYELQPKPEREGLPEIDLKKIGEKVVTRFAPNPSGAIHLGHARQAIMSHDLAKEHGGKFIVRFDDTDPKIKVPLKRGEEIILKDLEWLGIIPDEVARASDRFDLYYRFMEKAIDIGKAYVCDCNNEKWKKMKEQGEACKCRDLDAKENLKRFGKMLKHEYKEGEVVLRIKTDIKHADPSLRDWWAARIVDKPLHPTAKDKYVWPSYNFASAIDDHEMGVTLIIRGQEHSQNAEKQKFLYKYFGWKYPECVHTGRVQSDIGVLSKSKINEMAEEKDFLGFSDPRLATIDALRRRGFQPEAIRKIIIEIGLKTSDTRIEFKKLAEYNKKFVENSERIGFLRNPVRLDVENSRMLEVDIDGRKYKIEQGAMQFAVDRKEIENAVAGETYRIRNTYDVKILKQDPLQVFAEFIGKTSRKMPVLHWLLQDSSIDAQIFTPDGKMLGMCDDRILNKKAGDIVYLEKFGYCRIDAIEDTKVVLFWAHE
ncbi:MAG: glutamate--tRNA ligase [Candidatus Diapherotrites archaeon]|nr:glutamate--tRNA ligase [Candidatus Diapherotrites archaeon]